MDRKSKILALIWLAALAAPPVIGRAANRPPSSASSSPGQLLAQGNNTFAVQMYRKIAGKPGNVFFSPYSISAALGMAYTGARNDTATQIGKALDFQLDSTGLNEAFKSVNEKMSALAKKEGIKLTIANGLSLGEGGVDKRFAAALQNFYDARLFSGGVEQINAWVRQKTQGRIDKIIERLSPSSACVILNAIYFKGLWKSPFSKKSTREQPFYLSSTRQARVPFMYRREALQVLDGKDFQAVSIPYAGEGFSMIILLPKTIEGLATLENRLSGPKLKQWLDAVGRQPARQTDLYLPRFTMESSYDLKPYLRELGMKKAFEKGADFSAIRTPKGALWIAGIKHKGFLDVDEKGTEASAATAVTMRALAIQRYPLFRADHPFLFVIRDNQSSMILFMGRQTDPESK
jgi:serpin B